MKRGLIPFALASLLAAQANAFELKSPDISAQGPIAEKFVFNSFGCKGENVSPALEWTDPPAGTKSFAVLVHDPDAPTGGAGFWHWIVTDIPASAHGLAQGAGTPDGKGLPPARNSSTATSANPGGAAPARRPDMAHIIMFSRFTRSPPKRSACPRMRERHSSASLSTARRWPRRR